MATAEQKVAERLEKREDVQFALEQAGGADERAVPLLAWIYILIRRPYRVGDRIRIGEATGDVIDVSYLDTTLWEFGGEYLSTDHPSGRLIKFPNSNVLATPVYNYSWPLFPYIWKSSSTSPTTATWSGSPR